MKASFNKTPGQPLTAADLCDRCSSGAVVETVIRAPDMVFIASSLSVGWPACLSLAGVVFVPAVRYN